MKTCPNCKTQNDDAYIHCGHCGTPLDREAPQSAEQILALLESAYATRAFLERSKREAIPEEVRQILAEIDEEFAFKMDTNAALISDLEAAVKQAVITSGKPVKGAAWQVIYSKPRVTWDTDKLDGLAMLLPQLDEARKVGQPSASIKKVGK